MKILVTGGAGYIGSITAHHLKNNGHEVIIFDSLEHGDKNSVKDLPLVIGKTTDINSVRQALTDYRIDAVIHFAAWIEMGESMKNPGKYFYNNYFGSLQLIRACVYENVDKLVFSSTAGVYGNPQKIPILEDDPKNPLNPYGESKLMVEKTLAWFDQIHHLRSITLRYFNAAGAMSDSSLGENHQPESHLIPNIIKAVQQDKIFSLFGNNYNTKDGTCVRDYIHVLDLAQAHLIALDVLAKGHNTDIYNAGTGHGFSNLEIIQMVEKISGKKVNLKIDKPRPGDADTLIADSSKFQQEFDFHPQYSDLDTIIKTAWDWHNK